MVGNDGECGVKDGGNDAGAGYAVYVSREVVVVIREQELGGDGGNAKSSREISSLGSKKG